MIENIQHQILNSKQACYYSNKNLKLHVYMPKITITISIHINVVIKQEASNAQALSRH